MQKTLLTFPRAGKWNGIDIVKLLMAFCVVAIHTGPFRAYSGTWGYTVFTHITQLAVPFFFLASGFLFARKLNDPFSAQSNLPAIGAFLRRFVRLYIIWSAVYLPLALADPAIDGQSVGFICANYLRKLIFRGEHYNSWHLWYLLSVIYVVLLLRLLTRLHVPFPVTFGICCTIYAVGLFLDWLNLQEGELPYVLFRLRQLLILTIVDGRILRGFLFVPIGMLLSRKVLRPVISCILLAGGFTVCCLTGGAIGELSLAVCVIGLFCLAQSLSLHDRRIYPFARQMSTVIYFIHMYVWTFLYWALFRTKTYSTPMFFLTSAVTAALAVLYVWLRGRVRTKRQKAIA